MDTMLTTFIICYIFDASYIQNEIKFLSLQNKTHIAFKKIFKHSLRRKYINIFSEHMVTKHYFNNFVDKSRFKIIEIPLTILKVVGAFELHGKPINNTLVFNLKLNFCVGHHSKFEKCMQTIRFVFKCSNQIIFFITAYPLNYEKNKKYTYNCTHKKITKVNYKLLILKKKLSKKLHQLCCN